MTRRWMRYTAALVALAACSPAAEETADPALSAGDTIAAATSQAAPTCTPSDRMALEGRASPYDSVSFMLDGQEAKLCYGRPSVNNRVIFGDLVPYDTLWRTGANEPTILHLPVAAEIAGIPVDAGSYSIYTVPGQSEWQIVVNSSTSQWGHESQYTEEIRATEIGRAAVPAEQTESPVETFVIHAEVADPGVDLVLEWEETRVRVPVRPR